jgi:tRNA threonylcarbamoyladenosine biosynthesis protein TsaE
VLIVELPTPAATGRLGRALGRLVHPPALIKLSGDLGTGKTTLVRHVLRARGVVGPVVSPSFTIAQSYAGRGGEQLHHLDLYRLGSGSDVDLFAWEDYVEPSALTFVEWPEAGADVLPDADVSVVLEHRPPRSRVAGIEAEPDVEEALAAALRVAGLRVTVPPAPLGVESAPPSQVESAERGAP